LEIQQECGLTKGMLNSVQDIHAGARDHVGAGVCVAATLAGCVQFAFQWFSGLK